MTVTLAPVFTGSIRALSKRDRLLMKVLRQARSQSLAGLTDAC